MSHSTMGCLSQREQAASGRSRSVLHDSKEVPCQYEFILEWVLCRREDSLGKTISMVFEKIKV